MSNLKLPQMTSYADARAILDTTGKSKVKIGRDTYLVDLADGPAVLYHDTYIIQYHPNGIITLDCGSTWSSARRSTRATVDRMHRLTPFAVQRRYPHSDEIEIRESWDGPILEILTYYNEYAHLIVPTTPEG